MKTNLKKTAAALFSSALVMSASVLAGPGPHIADQAKLAPIAQGSTVVSARAEKNAPPDFKSSSADNQRKARTVYTAHGTALTLF